MSEMTVNKLMCANIVLLDRSFISFNIHMINL
jgi:hypothetical protein